MNTVKLNSQKSLKKIDWKLFFNMRIFRYTFFKQLKSISTYIFFCLTIVSSGFILWGNFKVLSSQLGDLDIDLLKQVVKIPLSFYIFTLYMLFIIIFTLFIVFKSLQIFRDEMDDGTLLIFSSMPFSRLKLIVQKWLSLQTICLIFTLSVIFISPTIFLLMQGFSKSACEASKVFYKNSLSLIIASIIFQILISTFAVLISLCIGKTGTIGFLSLFSAISIVIFYIPSIIGGSLLQTSNSEQMNLKIRKLGKKSERINLFRYYRDPELKEFFELENWYTDQQLEKINGMPYHQELSEINNHEQFEFTFEPEIIDEIHNILTNSNDNDIQQKKQAFLAKNIKAKIETSSFTPKAVKEILKLFNKSVSETVNLCPVRVNSLTKFSSYKDDQKLIKSKDFYKTALDNNDNFTQKEKKIIQLSKSLFEDSNQWSGSSIEFVRLQLDNDMRIFINSIAKQYEKKYGSSTTVYGSHNIVNKMRELLENKGRSKSVTYFVDNPAFQNLSFLMRNLFKEVVSNMVQLKSSEKDNENLEKYFKLIKPNNYLNIMTQIALIWNNQFNDVDIPVLSIFLNNYYGEWEKKEINYAKSNGTSAKMEYLKMKPESFKRIISPTLLYILYPFISMGLVGLLIFIVYKRDFV